MSSEVGFANINNVHQKQHGVKEASQWSKTADKITNFAFACLKWTIKLAPLALIVASVACPHVAWPLLAAANAINLLNIYHDLAHPGLRGPFVPKLTHAIK